MDFRKEYVKSELTPSELPLSLGDCGIFDNINDQWKEKSKAYGLFNDKGYIFGNTYDFIYDHKGLTDKIMEIIGNPHFMICVDQDATDKVSVNLRPISSEPMTLCPFEKALINMILLETKEAFSTRPEGTRMRIDLALPIFDENTFISSTTITTIEDLDKQIALFNSTEEQLPQKADADKEVLKKKKSYKLLNLIPLVLFMIFDCLLAIGINPVRPIIIAALLIIDAVLAKDMKDYLISSLILYASCIIGIIVSVTCYYNFISNDFETPIVGAFIAIVYAISLLVLIGVGTIIVYLRKILSARKNMDQVL